MNKTVAEERHYGPVDFLKNVLPKMFAYKGYFFFLCFVLIVQTAFGVLYPVAYKPIIDNLSESGGSMIVIYSIMFLVVLYVTYTVTRIFGFYVASKLGANITDDIRRSLYKKIENISERDLHRYSSQNIGGFFPQT